MPHAVKCGTCVHFDPQANDTPVGLCRKVRPLVVAVERSGPRTGISPLTVFPQVNAHRDWCGEHTAAKP